MIGAVPRQGRRRPPSASLDRGGSEDGAARGNGGCAGGPPAAVRAGRRAAPVRLPPAGYPAGAGGHNHEPQEAATAVSRGRAGGAAPARPQAGHRHKGADGADRKSVGEGKSVSVRVDLGGRRIIKKKKIK